MPVDLDYLEPLECDVVIAGAELAGLVAGAILARHGQSVVVVDTPPQVGGRGGATRARHGGRDRPPYRAPRDR